MRINRDSSAYSESFKSGVYQLEVPPADRQTNNVKPVYPPFNFVEAGGIKIIYNKGYVRWYKPILLLQHAVNSGHLIEHDIRGTPAEHNLIVGPTNQCNICTSEYLLNLTWKAGWR